MLTILPLEYGIFAIEGEETIYSFSNSIRVHIEHYPGTDTPGITIKQDTEEGEEQKIELFELFNRCNKYCFLYCSKR